MSQPPTSDPPHDSHRTQRNPGTPAVCVECGALYAGGEWQWAPVPMTAATTTCPACLRMRDRRPAGHVDICAALAGPNHNAIVALVHKLEAAQKHAHPLRRIMAIEPGDGADGTLRISTTDPDFARELGEALAQRLHVQASCSFAEGEQPLRVELKD